ncbi:hypothetical protein Micbo1qcDRAFT_170338 [Microdochium bolleyi]|uniref:Uncharacterized protein n=1 Tax=Microdochium bolleyi TaxID=196109 RepID=A0A136JH85_9PEZI|nr:hypothetical protein Micbo1qcDRAFT_170338 [Microdochium bolleyi]
MLYNPLRAAVLLAALLPAAVTACVHFKGDIDDMPLGEGWKYSYSIDDNGEKVCDGYAGWRDGRWWAHCKEGFALSFSQTGKHVWYHAHGTNFEWDQDVHKWSECCRGACQDRGPKWKCTYYSWDTWMYC